MKMYFSQNNGINDRTEEDYTPVTLRESIEKTRQALEMAYAGFDNAVDTDLIDSYIYEINSLRPGGGRSRPRGRHFIQTFPG